MVSANIISSSPMASVSSIKWVPNHYFSWFPGWVKKQHHRRTVALILKTNDS